MGIIAISIAIAQTTIAVIDFDARNISVGEVVTLTDRFRDELIKTNQFTVIERGKMEEVLKEQGFQQTGCVSDECVVEVGQLIGVEQMVGGSIGKVGNIYSVSARIIEVASGKIIKVTTYDFEGNISNLLTVGMKEVARILVIGTKGRTAEDIVGYGDVYITTDPSDAEIWVDDLMIDGVTPFLVENLSVGSHVIISKKDGLSNTKIVEIHANEIQKTLLVLEYGKGRLKILSDPFEAMAYLDNKSVGKTPIILSDLNSGVFMLRIEKEDYDTYESQITVQPNGTVTINAILLSNLKSPFAKIPAGTFISGKYNKIKAIDYDYYISKHEITNSQYAQFLILQKQDGNISIVNNKVIGYYSGDERSKDGKYTFIDVSDKECQIRWDGRLFSVARGYNNHPVIPVTWYGANAYAVAMGCRLPTSFEWEKAARGDTGWSYPWGDNKPNCELLAYSSCSDGLVTVGLKSGKSVYGVYDMAGNAKEWVMEYYGSFGKDHTLMGGGYKNYGNDVKSWKKTNLTGPTGFRVVKDQMK